MGLWFSLCYLECLDPTEKPGVRGGRPLFFSRAAHLGSINFFSLEETIEKWKITWEGRKSPKTSIPGSPARGEELGFATY